MTNTNSQPTNSVAAGLDAPVGLPKAYRPAETEPRFTQLWEESRAFHADPSKVLRSEAEPYAIFIPPPNVTAALHLGHALNNTLQDVLIRAHRMMGFETLWMPGTDHAGIATQAVVEKRVWNEEGKRRHDFSRDQFVAKIQAFKDEYEAKITQQLKLMGCACDFERQRFTMDEQCAAAVREAFFQLFKSGLIYRGKRLVNWDPVLQTAVADDECYEEELDSFFYYMRYPLVRKTSDKKDAVVPVTWDELSTRGYPGANHHPPDQQAFITVATTRPETYLGDSAVAINPKDPRCKPLEGLYVQLPIVGRVIPIIADDYVVLPAAMWEDQDAAQNDPKAQYASGFLKVTPGHDQNDYDLYQRHKSSIDANLGGPSRGLINVFAPDATISNTHGWHDIGDAHIFLSLPREEARKKVVAEFKARGLLESTRPYRHSLKHSDRSKAVVEPYLSDQWYVKVTDPRLAQSANDALHKGELTFHPSRYAKTYEQWHDNIRDWCISRQLWWGHRVPVWYSPRVQTHQESDSYYSKLNQWERENKICIGSRDNRSSTDASSTVCLRVNDSEIIEHLQQHGATQDPDVLDTWFSSALWPLSTLGWPDPAANNPQSNAGLLQAFNPSSVLCTAREIITLWVSRMVMMNRYLYHPSSDSGARCLVPDASPPLSPSSPGPVPFRDVFIHAVIQDGQGQKMSKSLGNGVDPLDIIATHGADAMRFTLVQMTTQTQDVRMPVDIICPHTGEVFAPRMITDRDGYVVPAPIQDSPKDPKKKMVTGYGLASGQAKPSPDMPLAKNTSSKFDLGRNFCNKLWNATRFALGILSKAGSSHQSNHKSVTRSDLSLVDRWMLSRLAQTITAVEQALKNYEFSDYAEAMYKLTWWDFCDWYLEAIKPTVDKDPNQQAVLAHALQTIIRLMHPIMPFITEAIWEHVRDVKTRPIDNIALAPSRINHLLCTAGWPSYNTTWIDENAEREWEVVRELVNTIRNVRSERQVLPKRKVQLHASAQILQAIGSSRLVLETLAGLESCAVLTDQKPAMAVTFRALGHDLVLGNLADQIDAGAERDKLHQRLPELQKQITNLETRLSNPGYVAKAPPKLVEESKDQLSRLQTELAALQTRLQELG